MQADWTALPADIVVAILQHLNFRNKIMVERTCSAWRLVLLQVSLSSCSCCPCLLSPLLLTGGTKHPAYVIPCALTLCLANLVLTRVRPMQVSQWLPMIRSVHVHMHACDACIHLPACAHVRVRVPVRVRVHVHVCAMAHIYVHRYANHTGMLIGFTTMLQFC